MNQEIWHDDLYATRTTPVKPRERKHKSCAKFASEHKMIVSVFAEVWKKQYCSKLEKAMQLERLLNDKSDDFGNNAMHVAELYKQAEKRVQVAKVKGFLRYAEKVKCE